MCEFEEFWYFLWFELFFCYLNLCCEGCLYTKDLRKVVLLVCGSNTFEMKKIISFCDCEGP